MMKGRINLDYEHSPDPYDRHRALYLYLPTTEMTGDYTCKVSTLQNDVTGTKRMTVFGMYLWNYFSIHSIYYCFLLYDTYIILCFEYGVMGFVFIKPLLICVEHVFRGISIVLK